VSSEEAKLLARSIEINAISLNITGMNTPIVSSSAMALAVGASDSDSSSASSSSSWEKYGMASTIAGVASLLIVVVAVIIARNKRAGERNANAQFKETEPAEPKKSKFHKRKSCEDGDVAKELTTSTAPPRNVGAALHGRDPITVNPVFFEAIGFEDTLDSDDDTK